MINKVVRYECNICHIVKDKIAYTVEHIGHDASAELYGACCQDCLYRAISKALDKDLSRFIVYIS